MVTAGLATRLARQPFRDPGTFLDHANALKDGPLRDQDFASRELFLPMNWPTTAWAERAQRNFFSEHDHQARSRKQYETIAPNTLSPGAV